MTERRDRPLVCSSCLLAFPGSARRVWNAMEAECVCLNWELPLINGSVHVILYHVWVEAGPCPTSHCLFIGPYSSVCKRTVSLLGWLLIPIKMSLNLSPVLYVAIWASMVNCYLHTLVISDILHVLIHRCRPDSWCTVWFRRLIFLHAIKSSFFFFKMQAMHYLFCCLLKSYTF